MLAFGFATMISVKENLKVRNVIFFRFSMMLEMVFFVLVQIKKKNHQKADFFSRLLGMPIWGTFYSMFTTDS